MSSWVSPNLQCRRSKLTCSQDPVNRRIAMGMMVSTLFAVEACLIQLQIEGARQTNETQLILSTLPFC